MILPLPLVPFEEYMLADDRPAYPMSFFVRLRFSGGFEPVALESSCRTALGRHPLLSAVVRQTGRRRLQWVEHPVKPVIQWARGGAGFPPAEGGREGRAATFGAPIDLRAEPGLRLWVLQGEQATDLWAQFHHACCDGLGALRFLEDLLVGYAMAVGAAPEPAALRPLREERLRQRGRFGLTPWKLLRMLHRQAVGLLGVLVFFSHVPVPLVPCAPEYALQPLPDAYPAVCTREFNEEESAAARAAAKQQGATLNDLLTRDLFLALWDWRSRHFPGAERDWLRLSVPINLRTAADAELPAANVVSMVFVDRRPEDAADPSRLLGGIHRQMEQIKRLGLGLTFIVSLAAARMLPGGMTRMAGKTSRCSASGVLTNLGEPLTMTPLPRQDGRLVAGGAVLQRIELFAPLRPYTSAAFAVLTYAGRLCVALHYDPRPISPAQAEDVLDTFVRQVRESIRQQDRTLEP